MANKPKAQLKKRPGTKPIWLTKEETKMVLGAILGCPAMTPKPEKLDMKTQLVDYECRKAR